MKKLVSLRVLAGLAWLGYQKQFGPDITMATRDTPQAAVTPRPSAANVERATETFTCDGRIHCSQMRSCAEATYVLRHCPGTRMDGDNDGVPCEQQWCN